MNNQGMNNLIQDMATASGASISEVEARLSKYRDCESESEWDSDSDSESESECEYDSDGSIDLETMSLKELMEECKIVGVSATGNKKVLRERLWNWDDANVKATNTTTLTVAKKDYEPRLKPKPKPKPKRKAKPCVRS